MFGLTWNVTFSEPKTSSLYLKLDLKDDRIDVLKHFCYKLLRICERIGEERKEEESEFICK